MNWFWLAFISAIFSAASAVYEKKALFSLDALKLSFLISSITLLFSIPFFVMTEYGDIFSVSMQILFLKSILGAIAFLFVMLSIKNLEISEALPLLALTPGLVAILGVLIINDSLTLLEWFGVFLMLAGAYILEKKKETRNYFALLKGIFGSKKYIYVFIALVLFTISSLLDRILLKDYKLPPFTFMAFQQLFFVLIFSVIFLLKNKGKFNLLGDVSKEVFYILIIISAFTVIYRYTQIEATKLVPVALVLSVKRISVLMAIVFGGRLFREKNLLRRMIAAIIIMAGATILMNV